MICKRGAVPIPFWKKKSPLIVGRTTIYLIFGEIGQCWEIPSLMVMSSCASLLLVSLLSVERYFAVCRPLLHMKFSRRLRTLSHLGLVWIPALILTICILPSGINWFRLRIVWPNETLYEHFPSIFEFCHTQNVTLYAVGVMMVASIFLVGLLINATRAY